MNVKNLPGISAKDYDDRSAQAANRLLPLSAAAAFPLRKKTVGNLTGPYSGVVHPPRKDKHQESATPPASQMESTPANLVPLLPRRVSIDEQ